MLSTSPRLVLFDAGVFIGALLSGDPRHSEARPIVEQARLGHIAACTTTGILSEVYAALTWHKAIPPHSPAEAAKAVRLLVESPSAIAILGDGYGAALRMLEVASTHLLHARRVHDARHVSAALVSGVTSVYTYDPDDWQVFAVDGMHIAGPPSVVDDIARRMAARGVPGTPTA